MADSTSPSLPQTTPSTSSFPSQDDQTFYTWSTFFSILTGTASPSTTTAYFTARDTLHETRDITRCTSDTQWLLQHSPIIRFLRHNLSLLGHDISASQIRSRRCTTAQSGGFDPEYGILICANKIRNRGHLEDTIAHEMVHAWDWLRWRLDPEDLRHAACMENKIRASTLSGECRFMREFFTRGQWKITQQLQECVRRRATLSVANRPACKDQAHASRMVDEVWDSCFNDTRPFDEIYR